MAPRRGREAGRQGRNEGRLKAVADEAAQAHQIDDADHERLLLAASGGDPRAREALIETHQDWVASAVLERSGRGLADGDLFQEGIIGLIEAIEGFPGLGGRPQFEPFARDLIARAMDAALGAEERVVRDGKMLVQAADDYVRTELILRRELGRPGTAVELAERLEWSVQRAEQIGEIVADARRRHDEELLQYLEPGDLDSGPSPEEPHERDGE